MTTARSPQTPEQLADEEAGKRNSERRVLEMLERRSTSASWPSSSRANTDTPITLRDEHVHSSELRIRDVLLDNRYQASSGGYAIRSAALATDHGLNTRPAIPLCERASAETAGDPPSDFR